jgi:hypothetical protein
VSGVGVPFASLEGVAVGDAFEGAFGADVAEGVVVVLVADVAVAGADDFLYGADVVGEVVVEGGDIGVSPFKSIICISSRSG